MTAGSSASTGPGSTHTGQVYYEHSSAQRVNTDAVIVEALRAEYPKLHLAVAPQFSCNISAYAATGHASLAPIDNEKERLSWRVFIPPAQRLNGERGLLANLTKFSRYMLDWQGKEFVVVVAEGRDGSESYPQVTNQYILSASVEATNKLLFEVGSWSNELHGEIWVFDGGRWLKSAALFAGMIKASWDDVIMDENTKSSIRADVTNFFDSRDTYTKLKVPWKRGVIYYGPPGNGKTISIKAMMHELYDRKDPVPTLYVKSLASFAGPEYSINQIFTKARQTAPCYLVFEDLDSLVTDQVRSYFLNAVDGIQNNDGILMVGSTNHLDRLDPGIAKRPSRFDRKYKFSNPNNAERIQYMHFWQRKLADNKDIDFPDKLCPAIAKITHGFSFAYLQEAMVASLLAIARDAAENDNVHGGRTCLACLQIHEETSRDSNCISSDAFPGRYDWMWMVQRTDNEDSDLDEYVLWREVKKQVRILREEFGDGKGEKRK
nr:putative atpase yjob [Quercus suber]